MMELEMAIREYMLGRPAIKIEREDEDFMGEIVDANRGIVYGQIEVSDEGKLTNVMIDMEEITDNNDISLDEYEELELDDLKEMAEEFAEEFCTGDLRYVNAQHWIGDTILVTFEQFDHELNLPLPNSGAQVEINRQGFIVSATLNQTYYQLTYPEVKVTAEQAKEIVANEMLLKREIEETRDKLHIVYVPKNRFMAVGVDGQLTTVFDPDREEELPKKAIDAVTVTKTLPELLGIEPDMVLDDSDDVQTWTSPADENIYVRIDRSDAYETMYESVKPWDESQQERPITELEDNAKQFLELVVGEVHTKFELEEQLEEDEPELTEEELAYFRAMEEAAEEEGDDEFDDEFDDEEDNDFEPFRTFSFLRTVQGIPVDEYNIHVDVGIYTGNIKDCTVTRVNEAVVENFSIDQATVSLEEANQRYIDALELRLARAIESNDDFPIYTLVYEIIFNGGKSTLEKVESNTGELIFEELYLED